LTNTPYSYLYMSETETITYTTTAKLDETELSTLHGIKQAFTEKLLALGQLKLEQMKVADNIQNLQLSAAKLQEHENNLKADFIAIQNAETQFLDKLSSKYGQGSINVSTGEITPRANS